MIFEETMAELEKMGTAQNRKIYQRHGSGPNLYGVSFANLNKLQKKIKKDHSLALKLWSTGNTDAMSLAVMVVDPEAMDEKTIENWVKDAKYYMLVDIFVKDVVSQTNLVEKLIEKWTRSEDEWIGRAGWQLLAVYAGSCKTCPDTFFLPYIAEAQKNIHGEKNRKREAMNTAVIAMGIRGDQLEKEARKAAEIIGPVLVDHGETSCKTPDIIEYIDRVNKRRASRGIN